MSLRLSLKMKILVAQVSSPVHLRIFLSLRGGWGSSVR